MYNKNTAQNVEVYAEFMRQKRICEQQFYDKVTEKFGFNEFHMLRLVKHFNLDEDEQVKKTKNMIMVQAQEHAKREKERLFPSEELKAKIEKECKELGKNGLKQDGTFSVNYFEDFYPIILRNLYIHCNDELDELNKKRRLAVKNNDERAFN